MREYFGGQKVLRTGLFLAVLTVLLGAIYLGTIALLNQLVVDDGPLGNILDVNSAQRLIAGLATAVVLLLLNPTRHWLEWLTDRFILRGRVDHRQALLTFTRQVRLIQTLDPLLDALMELIRNTIVPRFCVILLPPRPGSSLVTVRQAGVVPVDLGTISPDDPLLVRALQFGEAISMDSLVHGSTAWRAWRQLDVTFVVPLVVGEDLIGLLALGPKQHGSLLPLGPARSIGGYSREDLWMLNTLADQSAVAIETARLYDQSLRRTAEVTAMFEMGVAISSSLDEDETLVTAANQLIDLLQVDGCVISDWDQDRDRLVNLLSRFAKGQVTLPEAGTPLPLSDHPARQVLQGKLPQAITAIESPDQAHRVPLIASGQMYAVLMLPLVARDNVIGLVELYSSAPRRYFTPRDIQLGQTLANQAAVAIANARLYKEARRSAAELSALVETGTIVATILDIQGALQMIAQEMVRILRAAGCRVSSWDRERDQIVSWLDYHLPDVPWVPGPLGTVYPLESRPDFALVLHERCVVSTTIPLPDQVPDAPLRPETAQTVLVLPLIARDEVIGVIELGADRPERVFTEWEIGLAQSLVNQAATAIENTRIYEEQRIAARNLERKVEARTAELNEAVQTLLVEASKREAILEGVADGVLFADAEGEITVFNVAAARLLGVPRPAALGNSVEGFLAKLNLPGEVWKEIPHRWAEMHQRPDETAFIEQRYEVGSRTFSIRLAPVVRERRFLGTVAVWRDITQDVELSRAKSEFVSSVSHELRIPMTSIKGYADLLLMGAAGELNDKQAEFLQTIQGNADRLTVLVNDLLDISRIETGRMELKLAKVDLNRVASDVIAALRPRADEKGQSLTNEIPVNLPPVRADADRVAQILTNLIGNAIAYTPDEGYIRVLGRLLDGQVQVDVIDNGVGIAPEEQARVWERFYRSEHPFVSEQVGTGLGLPIVRSLVELHGGEVWIESELGVGSTFSLTLPVMIEAWEEAL
jgi:PAS domain S-box-containing protein